MVNHQDEPRVVSSTNPERAQASTAANFKEEMGVEKVPKLFGEGNVELLAVRDAAVRLRRLYKRNDPIKVNKGGKLLSSTVLYPRVQL